MRSGSSARPSRGPSMQTIRMGGLLGRMESRTRRVMPGRLKAMRTTGYVRAPESMPLLDGDRLGEVAGLVDVAAAGGGYVVREQLQRHGAEQGIEEVVLGRGDLDAVVGDLVHRVGLIRGDGHRGAAARLDLAHVGDHLVERRALGRTDD